MFKGFSLALQMLPLVKTSVQDLGLITVYLSGFRAGFAKEAARKPDLERNAETWNVDLKSHGKKADVWFGFRVRAGLLSSCRGLITLFSQEKT